MQIAIALYPGFTALDFVGPYQVLTLLPGAEVVLVADAAGPVTDDNGLLTVHATHAFADVGAPDVVLVPGGSGTRAVLVGPSPIVDWVRSVAPGCTWVTSVCTGALVLGAAGLLEGRRAITHWNFVRHLAGFGATVADERVVVDGNVITGAGVSAGIDMALGLVARLADDDTARAIQLGIEYDPQPPFDAGAPSKAPTAIRDLVASVMDATEAETLRAASSS